MEKVLLNMVASVSGGGLQNALSLIRQLPQIEDLRANVIVVCKKNSDIYNACKRLNLDLVTIPNGVLGRLWFEFVGCYALMRRNKIKYIFTLFGNCPIFTPGIYKISGFAYSNILMPEVPFWDFLPYRMRVGKWLKDRLRLWGSFLSDEIIFETYFLFRRAKSSPLGKRILHVVEMEPSEFVIQDLQSSKRFFQRESYRDFLFITGPHPNKRVHLFAEILKQLNQIRIKNGLHKARVFITMERTDGYPEIVWRSFAKNHVDECLFFLGPVPQENVGRLLRKSFVIVNIARLESFSNNWVEAWAANLPLVSTDADWSRSSCDAAAIYIDPEKPSEAAARLFRALCDGNAVNALTSAGRSNLERLRSRKKVFSYYEILLKAQKRNES